MLFYKLSKKLQMPSLNKWQYSKWLEKLEIIIHKPALSKFMRSRCWWFKLIDALSRRKIFVNFRCPWFGRRSRLTLIWQITKQWKKLLKKVNKRIHISIIFILKMFSSEKEEKSTKNAKCRLCLCNYKKSVLIYVPENEQNLKEQILS